MRHRKMGNNFGRTSEHREAMFRNMVTSLLKHEKIRTTTQKAKSLRTTAEKMITLGKRANALGDAGDQGSAAKRLHYRRQALRVVREKDVVAKLFAEIAPRYMDRPGGYTRILKLGRRIGDDADMAIIELVEQEMPEKKAPGAKRKKAAAKPKAKATAKGAVKPGGKKLAKAAEPEKAAESKADPEVEDSGEAEADEEEKA